MSPTLIVAVAIVLASSIGLVVVGAAYGWDLTSRGYARWTRVIGVLAVVGLTAVTAWSRRGEPGVVAAIIVGGVVLSVGFVLLHRHLTARVRAALESPPAE